MNHPPILEKWVWTTPNDHWGTAVNLAIEKLDSYWWKFKPSYTTLILCPLKTTLKSVMCKSNIWDRKQACFQYSHPSLMTPEALKPCRSVLIAAHTHVCTHARTHAQGNLWRAGEGALWQDAPLLIQANSLSCPWLHFPFIIFFSQHTQSFLHSDNPLLLWPLLFLIFNLIRFHGLLFSPLCILLVDFPLHPCCMSSVRVYVTFVFYLCQRVCVCVCCVKAGRDGDCLRPYLVAAEEIKGAVFPGNVADLSLCLWLWFYCPCTSLLWIPSLSLSISHLP